MSEFADEFEQLMASGGRRRSSPNEIIDAWEAFVAECEDGYGWSIYEYQSELGMRGALETVLRPPLLMQSIRRSVSFRLE